MDGLETQYPDLTVRRVNADLGDGPALMRAHQIIGHPTVILVDAAGTEQARFLGPQAAQDIEAAVGQMIAP